jgi:glucose/arabinose dehydrogenase
MNLALGLLLTRIALEQCVTNVEFPVHLAHDGTKRLYVVEQRGRIRVVEDGKLQAQPLLDIRDRVRFGGECGLLCVAFHPQFAANGRYFVNYTSRQDGELHTRISEFRAGQTNEHILLKFRQPWANHNGGQILFGPDGKLYIGTGDGGAAGDPLNSGQRLDTVLGKILTLDVDKPGAQTQIYAFGLRNPWRFAFDRVTGLLWCADVGQNKWEEINLIERGGNYGWNIREGAHPFKNDRPTTGLVEPIKEYGHDLGVSITGGHVYRGRAMPTLVGWYVYGDYESGRIWGLRYENGRVTGDAELLKTSARISSFGEDVDGELYVCSHYDGMILKIVAAR